jgi:hypothetical protein
MHMNGSVILVKTACACHNMNGSVILVKTAYVERNLNALHYILVSNF